MPTVLLLELSSVVWKLLRPEEIGVQLIPQSRDFMMDPEASVALTTNLRHELISNLTHLLQKLKDGSIRANCHFLPASARQHFTGGLDDTSTIPALSLKWLAHVPQMSRD